MGCLKGEDLTRELSAYPHTTQVEFGQDRLEHQDGQQQRQHNVEQVVAGVEGRHRQSQHPT